MSQHLRGSVVVVTGGGRGIGLACAERLARAGADVALLDLLPEVASVAAALPTPSPAVGVAADVTDPASVAAALDEVAARLGRPTALVHAAGTALVGDALTTSVEAFERVLRVNLTGTFVTAQAFARLCVAAGRPGDVVAIASMSARVVNVPQRQSAYNASKAGVEALVRSLAVEWADLGVRVNGVSPGYVATEQTRGVLEGDPATADAWRSRIPLGDVAQPDDVAGVVEFLLSPASRYVLGQCLLVDGGYTAM